MTAVHQWFPCRSYNHVLRQLAVTAILHDKALSAPHHAAERENSQACLPLPFLVLSVVIKHIFVIDCGVLCSGYDVVCKFFGHTLEQVPSALQNKQSLTAEPCTHKLTGPDSATMTAGIYCETCSIINILPNICQAVCSSNNAVSRCSLLLGLQ